MGAGPCIHLKPHPKLLTLLAPGKESSILGTALAWNHGPPPTPGSQGGWPGEEHGLPAVVQRVGWLQPCLLNLVPTESAAGEEQDPPAPQRLPRACPPCLFRQLLWRGGGGCRFMALAAGTQQTFTVTVAMLSPEPGPPSRCTRQGRTPGVDSGPPSLLVRSGWWTATPRCGVGGMDHPCCPLCDPGQLTSPSEPQLPHLQSETGRHALLSL